MNRISAWQILSVFLLPALLVAPHGQSEETQEDWFQIEAILFEHQQSDLDILRFEYLDRILPTQREDYLYYYELGAPLSANHIKPLEDDQRDLLEAFNRLNLDPLTRPVVYYAWQQAVARNAPIPPVKVHAGPETGPHAMFEGYLQLRRNRYTHMAIDVFKNQFRVLPYNTITEWLLEDDWNAFPVSWLAMPLQVMNGALTLKGTAYVPMNTLHISQSRRVKDGEIHYIDHPALGLIVTIKSIPNPNSLDAYDAEAGAP